MSAGSNYSASYNYTPPPAGGDLKGFNPDYTSVFKNQNSNFQNFNNNQLGQIGGFQGAYQSATNALPTYQTLYNNANKQFGVEPLAKNAASLENTLLQVPQTYSQATQGSDTNNNQLMQLIGQKQWELAPQATAATNAAQAAQTLANQAVGYGVQNESFLTQPYQTAAPMITSQLASAASGFNQQQANELAALTAKMNAGIQLTTTEMNNLTQLQVAQKAYDQAVATANITANYAGNRYVTLKPGEGAWNTSSGVPVYNTYQG